jgi:SSS family solute:Na+ symporter
MKHFTFLDQAVLTAMIGLFVIMVLATRWRAPANGIYETLMAGRRLTIPSFAITLVSSWYAGVLSATQIAYKNGIYNFIVLGVFWYIAAIIFAFGFAHRIFKSGAMTLPTLVGNAYGRNAEKTLLYLLLVKTMPINYIMAFTMIITFLFGINAHIAWFITIMVGLLMLMRTSFRSVVLIDMMQFLVIFSTLAMVCYYSSIDFGGLSTLLKTLPESHLQAIGNNDYSKLILWFLVSLNTTVLSPIFHQRCAASNSSKTAQRGILLSLVFWLISDILTTLVGLYAFICLGEGYQDSAFMELILRVMPHGLIGYAMAALFITGFSALDSHIFASRSLIESSFFATHSHRFKAFMGIALLLTAAVISQFLNNDLEKAWLLFDSAFISSLLVPALIALRNPRALTSRQFTSIIITTFILSALAEYMMLSEGKSSCLWMLLFNATCVSLCWHSNKKHRC